MEFVFREAHLKSWYMGDKVENLLWHMENLDIIRQVYLLSGKQLFTAGPTTLKQTRQMILQMVCYPPPLRSKKGTALQTYTSPDFYPVTSEKST